MPTGRPINEARDERRFAAAEPAGYRDHGLSPQGLGAAEHFQFVGHALQPEQHFSGDTAGNLDLVQQGAYVLLQQSAKRSCAAVDSGVCREDLRHKGGAIRLVAIGLRGWTHGDFFHRVGGQ
jgi:hypothetical protein